MVTFLTYQFSVSPEFLPELQETMNEAEWYQEFVSYTPDGEITLFDIQDGNTKDAIQQVMSAFSIEGSATVKINIIVCEMSSITRFQYKASTQELLTDSATDFVWSNQSAEKI